MNKDQLLQLRSLPGYYRKPTKWEEVGYPIRDGLLVGLKTYRSTDLGIYHNVANDFMVPPDGPITDIVFLVSHDSGLYLVNTEGFNYARYIRYVGMAPMVPGTDTTEYVIDTLKKSGYFDGNSDGAKGVQEAKFKGFNSTGQEMHTIIYLDDDNAEVKDIVFIWNEGGEKRADF